MASSDEEGEILPQHVTEYYFVDDKENLVSFDILPLPWTEGEVLDGPKTQVFVSGDAENGLQKVYKSVIAWKLELSYVKPVVLVLSKGRKWITLQKPRKSYENTIRTILITIHWLHLIKKNPEASRQFVWNHLRQAFSFYDTEPCENDLLQHMLLINQTVKRDEDLMKSKYVVTFLEKPSTGQPSHEQGIQKIMKTGFIVYEDEDNVVNSDGEEVVSSSIFDTVCSICDNGGTVLCCEGSCLRSFHPTKADGSDSLCQSLGFLNHVQVDALPSFLCKNCLYKQHQCYACGKLGSSDTSKGQEVFSCSSATCGHFYHPECVARLLHIGNENEALKLQATIAVGKSFTCPMHKCYICKQSEDAAVDGLQMAICRRCPKAYHRKCLPKMITLEFTTDKNLLRRAWDGLLPENRILIYCMDHKIDGVLGTPGRDHLKFPDLEGREKQDKLEVPSCKGKVTDSIQSMSSEHFAANRPPMKKAKLSQKFGSDIEAYNENTDEKCSRQDFDILKKPIGETAKNYLEKNFSSDIERHFKTDKSKFLSTKGNTKLNLGLAMCTLGEVSSRSSKIRNTVQTMPMVKPLVTLDMEKGIRTLMKNSASSFNVEEFKKRRQIPVTYACNPCKMLDKTITFGRVEASVRAVQAALEKLEAGGSIEDAKTICGPEVLKQIAMWKEKLQVFLAPFLHGMRYTSFGRHFTKLEKLKEIVDRLCWYVQNGDTIVDFSCGSNDFSCLMKEKLENMGKFCSFKNYDLFRPKNDFNFEQRDWMSINLNELPDGSQLIMGLNPPFGFKASLANMFINKALQFRPKLIVLIVPEETKRIDKKAPYDLVWEDDRILSGKSFYLPGSVDVDDKHLEQWNLKSPPLYLWSRRDWAARHKAIAQEHNHICNAQEEIHRKEHNDNEVRFKHLMEEHNDGCDDFFKDMQECIALSSIFDGVPIVDNNFEPGEVRTLIPPSEHREGSFPCHCSSSRENDDMAPWETDSMCREMEISTP
ncbi:hypothetical protein SLA2020_087140 [Shorea laevis]